ncbi:MAG: hypothetical protein AAF250_03025 [Pseudomonadota bacterium]
MFGFNKNKPLIQGPIEFEAEIEIDRSASVVFPLLDLASPEFAHLQRGASVEALDGELQQYRLTIEAMEGVAFLYRVLDRVEGERHEAECVIEPRINDLLKAVERYEITARGADACHVKLTTIATFDESLSDEEVAGEIAMMSLAVNDDLHKLKVHAEEGPEAVAAMEEEDDLGFEIDLGDLDLDWDDIEPEQ